MFTNLFMWLAGFTVAMLAGGESSVSHKIVILRGKDQRILHLCGPHDSNVETRVWLGKHA